MNFVANIADICDKNKTLIMQYGAINQLHKHIIIYPKLGIIFSV